MREVNLTHIDFRWVWAKVLPTVYDDTLSYYEQLCKIAEALDKLSTECEDHFEEIYAALDLVNGEIRYLDGRLDVYDAKKLVTYGGVWDVTKSYDAYTVVDYSGTDYISLQSVPVGVAITNTSYWDVLADNSGLAARVGTLEDEVAEISRHNQSLPTRILCIGDSYGMKITENWVYHLGQILGNSVYQIINKCTGSSGFVGNTGIATFYDQLRASDITSKETITHIIIAGGFNDAYRSDGSMCSQGDLATAIENCKTYIKAYYPNAIVYIGFCGYATALFNDASGSDKSMHMMYQCATMAGWYDVLGGRAGWCVMKNLKYVLKWGSYFNKTDYTYNVVFHPNSSGNMVLASEICSYLRGGDLDLNVSINPTFTLDASFTSSATGFFEERQSCNVYKLLMNSIPVTCNTSLSTLRDNWKTLVTMNNDLIYPHANKPLFGTGVVLAVCNGNNKRLPVLYRFGDSKLDFILCPDELTDYTITAITFMPIYFIGVYGEC